ncbi:MAG: PAS domain S-box protein [Candidatus Thorarchaeota archaeon]|nr:PAS domain S-box protein [Candidatus Thorarchaeota archaeon]
MKPDEVDQTKCHTLNEIHTALMNTISDGVAIIKDGKIINANPALMKILGNDVEGRNISNIISPVETFETKFLPDVSDSQFQIVSLRRRSGESLLVEYTSESITYDGEPAELYVFRDLTPQFEMARAAEKCELRYTEIFTKSPIAFITISPRGIIQDINRAAAELLGYTPEQLLKRPGTALFGRDERSKRAGSDLITAAISGKNVTDVEVEFVKVDGTTTWVSVTSYPIIVDGRIDSVMLMAIDINRRRLAEIRETAERNRANLYLEVMTHDLNNINQELVFALGLLTESLDIPETIQSLIDQTIWNIRRSARMIRNMRSLLRLQTEPPTTERTELKDVFSTAVTSVQEDLSWKSIHINYDPDELSISVAGNEYVQDVFFNIIHNAAFYDPSQDVSIDVSVKDDAVAHRVKVIIEDNGPGIPDPLKEAVFRRTEENARKKAGRGLGLTLINAIMQSIGGTVWVEDRIKNGEVCGTRVNLEFEAWTEAVELPCGRKTCITFYKSDHCLFCEPSKEVLLQSMQALGIAMKHLEIINVDDPTAEVHDIDISMLPVVRICDTELYGFFEGDAVQGALLNLMLKPCFPDT